MHAAQRRLSACILRKYALQYAILTYIAMLDLRPRMMQLDLKCDNSSAQTTKRKAVLILDAALSHYQASDRA